MYEAWGFANPPPEHTAIFSMSVDAEHACIIIHWRFADEDGVVSYEAERVKTCLLSDAVSVYHLRSIIFNMLQWARDTRLPHMRKMFKERKILKDRVEGSQVESTTASLSGEAHGKVAISEQDNETTQTEAGQSSDNIDSLTITVEGTSGGSEGRTPLKALSVNSSTGETAPAEDRGDEQSMPPPPKRQCKSLTAKPSRTMSKKKHDPKALATHSHTS